MDEQVKEAWRESYRKRIEWLRTLIYDLENHQAVPGTLERIIRLRRILLEAKLALREIGE